MEMVLVVCLILQDHGHVGCEALRARGIVGVDFRYRAILIQLLFLEGREGKYVNIQVIAPVGVFLC